MSGYTLELLVEGYAHRIEWVDEEGVGCAFVGETAFDNEPTDPDEWETWAAWQAVKAAPGCGGPDRTGFFFERMKDARAALALAKAAVRKQPLADWEAKALAAGWKPPKGRKIP